MQNIPSSQTLIPEDAQSQLKRYFIKFCIYILSGGSIAALSYSFPAATGLFAAMGSLLAILISYNVIKPPHENPSPPSSPTSEAGTELSVKSSTLKRVWGWLASKHLKKKSRRSDTSSTSEDGEAATTPITDEEAKTAKKGDTRAELQYKGAHTVAIFSSSIIGTTIYLASSTYLALFSGFITLLIAEGACHGYLSFARYNASQNEKKCKSSKPHTGTLSIEHQNAVRAPSGLIANGLAWAGLFGDEFFWLVISIAAFPLAKLFPGYLGQTLAGFNILNRLSRMNQLYLQFKHGSLPEDVEEIVKKNSLAQRLKRAFLYAAVFAIPIIIVLTVGIAIAGASAAMPPLAIIPIIGIVAAVVIVLSTSATFIKLDTLDEKLDKILPKGLSTENAKAVKSLSCWT